MGEEELEGTTEYVDAETFIAGVFGWYEQLLFPRMEKVLDSKSTEQEKEKALEEIVAGMKDYPVDGEEFIWKDYTIEGNNQLCVRGTVVDVYSPESDIFATYKKLLTAIKCLKAQSNKNHKLQCVKYCKGCASFSALNCMKAVAEAKKQAVDVDFPKIREKFKTGAWKL